MEAVSDLKRWPLLLSVFVVAICGLVYELITGAVASYLIGNSVVQYSMVIGVFLAAMGLGSWLTKFMEFNLLRNFIKIQAAVGVVGGFSATILFTAYRFGLDMTVVVIALSMTIGCLMGMEIPIILRLVQGQKVLQVTVPEVLALDYSGALVASLVFPFVLLPYLGLTRAAFLFGLINVAVAGLALAFFWQLVEGRFRLAIWLAGFSGVLLLGFSTSSLTTTWFEDSLYQDEIVLAEDTPYQRIVITRWNDDVRLFLNGHLQFSSADEYRYHETLVDPVMSLASKHPIVSERKLRVLVLGGGDGLALRRVLQYKDVGHVDLVDLDKRVVELFTERPDLAVLNDYALQDTRVKTHFQDAFEFLARADIEPYDVMILDLPDPGSTATNKLFTRTFYVMALRLSTGVGGIATQATSPFYARKAFWCIYDTMKAALTVKQARVAERWNALPYHAYVPSFGDWGFVLLTPRAKGPQSIELTKKGRFLSSATLPGLFEFPDDIGYLKTAVNSLDQPYLIGYHNDGWNDWNL